MNMGMALFRPLLVMVLLAAQINPLETKARDVVTAFLSGQIDAAAAMFKPPAQGPLKQARERLVQQLDKFDSVTGVKFVVEQGNQVALVSADFAKGSVELAVTFSAAGDPTGMRVTSVKPLTIPWDPPAYADSKKFSEKDLTLGISPWQLPAILTLPAGAGPFPAVVLVHGSGPQDEDETIQANKPFKDLAWGLASNGIAVLRYKKRTAVYGREMAALKLTVMDETVNDARAAIALLAKTEKIDAKRIFIIGHSLGGMLAPRIASGTSAAGIIIMAGNTRPLIDVMVEQIQHLKADGLTSQAAVDSILDSRKYVQGYLEPTTQVDVAGTSTPGSYWLDLRTYDPAKAAVALHLPMLIIQGTRDYQVANVDYEGWMKALNGRKDVKFKLYPGLNHVFAMGTGPASPKDYAKPGHVDGEVIRDITNWLTGPK